MRVLNAVKNAIKELFTLVFVPKCSACGTPLPSKDIPLCDKCKESFLLESKMPCKKCGKAHKLCSCRIDTMGVRFPLTHVTGYDIKRSSVSKSIILAVKDDLLESAFDFLADEMLTALKERYLRLFERTNVVITYVPRSERARRKAGHDQAEQIALRVARKSGATFMPLFVNNGKKKQKTLTGVQRQKNAVENYALIMPELKLKGQTVVIIDDIVTTGASIGACGLLARSAGAKAVIALSWAKSQREKGVENKYKKEENEYA